MVDTRKRNPYPKSHAVESAQGCKRVQGMRIAVNLSRENSFIDWFVQPANASAVGKRMLRRLVLSAASFWIDGAKPGLR
jgi:hypothetical protein